jgi:hypothetical protein
MRTVICEVTCKTWKIKCIVVRLYSDNGMGEDVLHLSASE